MDLLSDPHSIESKIQQNYPENDDFLLSLFIKNKKVSSLLDHRDHGIKTWKYTKQISAT